MRLRHGWRSACADMDEPPEEVALRNSISSDSTTNRGQDCPGATRPNSFCQQWLVRSVRATGHLRTFTKGQSGPRSTSNPRPETVSIINCFLFDSRCSSTTPGTLQSVPGRRSLARCKSRNQWLHGFIMHRKVGSSHGQNVSRHQTGSPDTHAVDERARSRSQIQDRQSVTSQLSMH